MATIAITAIAVIGIVWGLMYDQGRHEEAIADAPSVLASQLQRDVPVSISVMGDSTGFRKDYWVDKVSERIADAYDRTVIYSRWNKDILSYDPPVTVSQGVGAAIHIWNASAPGESPRYFQQNFDAIVAPVGTPTFILINHGHNTGPDPVLDISRLTNKVQERFASAPIGLIVQNPYLSEAAEVSESRAEAVRSWARSKIGFTTIDVDKAFRDSVDIEALYLDPRHPNDLGSQIWAEEVERAVGIPIV